MSDPRGIEGLEPADWQQMDDERRQFEEEYFSKPVPWRDITKHLDEWLWDGQFGKERNLFGKENSSGR